AEMELAWVPLDEAVAAVLDGRMHSPSGCMGVLAAAAARADGWASVRSTDALWFRSEAQTR
ncbi:MAG: ADP-ribose diphosphatase, partial [bacterium]|nr:ADP-ribose diphosphatase [bacterium]